MQAFAFIVLLATSVNAQTPWDPFAPAEGFPVVDCIPLANMVAIGKLTSECCWAAQANIASGAIAMGMGNMIPECLAGPTADFCDPADGITPLSAVLDYAGLHLCCRMGHPDTPTIPCGQQMILNAATESAAMNGQVVGGFDAPQWDPDVEESATNNEDLPGVDGLMNACKDMYDAGTLGQMCDMIGGMDYDPDTVYLVTDAPTAEATEAPVSAPTAAATEEPTAPPTEPATDPPVDAAEEEEISGASGVSASVALVTTLTLGLLGLQRA